MTDFIEFQKIPRLSREVTITEKIDGTCSVVYIGEDGEFLVGSRTRWITPENDNYGFARWAMEHKDELMQLGPGRHFGEWWGQGIQRKYGMTEKRFSLFNTHKWGETRPDCCRVVPVLYTGIFDTNIINAMLTQLQMTGSIAAPGFMQPEGIVIYHTAANMYFKKTIEKDAEHKSQQQ
jgi:hypothetical protein